MNAQLPGFGLDVDSEDDEDFNPAPAIDSDNEDAKDEDESEIAPAPKRSVSEQRGRNSVPIDVDKEEDVKYDSPILAQRRTSRDEPQGTDQNGGEEDGEGEPDDGGHDEEGGEGEDLEDEEDEEEDEDEDETGEANTVCDYPTRAIWTHSKPLRNSAGFMLIDDRVTHASDASETVEISSSMWKPKSKMKTRKNQRTRRMCRAKASLQTHIRMTRDYQLGTWRMTGDIGNSTVDGGLTRKWTLKRQLRYTENDMVETAPHMSKQQLCHSGYYFPVLTIQRYGVLGANQAKKKKWYLRS